MKTFTSYEPASKEFIKIAVKERGFALEENHIHPQEDYLLKSKNHPIFAVADGVTLEFHDGKYPNPSGAGELAKIFCHTVVDSADEIYDYFSENSLRKLFEAGNKEAKKFNEIQGRTKDKINYWDFDLFAITTAFVLIKDSKVYWWTLCDSGISVIDKNGKIKFQSPDCWKNLKKHLPFGWSAIDPEERRKIIRRMYRNGKNEKGELIGYGVVTGEDVAGDYLNTGTFDLDPEDMIFVYTDGFEPYFKLKEFERLFTNWPINIEEKFKDLSDRKIKENPSEFGHERSLIVIKT